MCKIDEVRSYQIFGKLHPTKEAAVEAGLVEVTEALRKNHANNLLGGLKAVADDLVYLLTIYRELHPLPSAPREPQEEALPDKAPTTLSDEPEDPYCGHAPACRYRATGIRERCNCDVDNEEDADV